MNLNIVKRKEEKEKRIRFKYKFKFRARALSFASWWTPDNRLIITVTKKISS